MEVQEKIEVEITRNNKVSTFFFKLKVSNPSRCAYDFDGIFCEECPSQYKGSDEAGIKARYWLSEIRNEASIRRVEIQEKRQIRKEARKGKVGRPPKITK